MSASENNKRIAKNTLLLYFRMILTMLVSLYTARVVINALGVEDYGIYNVVGGIVVILSFLNGAMAGATQRFLNVEMGKRDSNGLKIVFDTSIIIHLGISVVILFFAETLGLWFLNNHLNISAERMPAANWVFQFSVATFIVNVISVPFNATIIAHEKMSAFAYISILEVSLKLLVVLLLCQIGTDKLIFYAFLLFCVGIIKRVIYGLYCKRQFEECSSFQWKTDRTILKKMLSFSSWTIFGNLGYMSHTEGIAIVMNIFFGTTVNAAQGIANRVNSVVSQLVSSFLTALSPQVVKTYAAGDLKTMHKLILRGSRLAFFLVMFFSLPLILEAPFVLKLWLKLVPDYTVIFVRLILVITLFNSFSSLLATAKGATGDIRVYQITLTIIGILHVPLSIVFFHIGFEPYSAMYIYLGIVFILQFVRVWMVCNSIKLSKRIFVKQVIFRCALCALCLVPLPLWLSLYLPSTFLAALVIGIVSMGLTLLSALFIGLSKDERQFVLTQVKIKLKIAG